MSKRELGAHTYRLILSFLFESLVCILWCVVTRGARYQEFGLLYLRGRTCGRATRAWGAPHPIAPAQQTNTKKKEKKGRGDRSRFTSGRGSWVCCQPALSGKFGTMVFGQDEGFCVVRAQGRRATGPQVPGTMASPNKFLS